MVLMAGSDQASLRVGPGLWELAVQEGRQTAGTRSVIPKVASGWYGSHSSS